MSTEATAVVEQTTATETSADPVLATANTTKDTAATKDEAAVLAAAATTEGDKEAAKAADEAPAEVEIKLPDGAEVDPDVLAALKGGTPQERADAYLAAQQKGREAYAQQQKAWVEELRADKDFGGANFDKNVALANRAVAKFGSPALTSLLNDTGLGNHAEVVRLFHRLAVADAEDTVAGTAAAEPTRVSTLQAQLRTDYPTMFKETT